VLRDNLGKLETYEDDDWRHAIEKGSYVTGLVLSVSDKDAVVKIGPYRGILSAGDFAWTGRKKPGDLLKVGDLGNCPSKNCATIRCGPTRTASPARRVRFSPSTIHR